MKIFDRERGLAPQTSPVPLREPPENGYQSQENRGSSQPSQREGATDFRRVQSGDCAQDQGGQASLVVRILVDPTLLIEFAALATNEETASGSVAPVAWPGSS